MKLSEFYSAPTTSNLTLGRYNSTFKHITIEPGEYSLPGHTYTVDTQKYQGLVIDSSLPGQTLDIQLTNVLQNAAFESIEATNIDGNADEVEKQVAYGAMVFNIILLKSAPINILNTIIWPDGESAPMLGENRSVIALSILHDGTILGSIGHQS